MIKYIGVFPIRNHYYEPQFKNEYLRSKIKRPNKNSLIFNEKKINKNLLNQLKYKKELLKLKLDQSNSKSNYKINNPFFSRSDGDFLYQFLRHTKPKRIIEIGSGYSTLYPTKQF